MNQIFELDYPLGVDEPLNKWSKPISSCLSQRTNSKNQHIMEDLNDNVVAMETYFDWSV